MRELFKLAFILAAICCGAALALGSVYELTKEPIARQQQLKKQRAVAAVFPGLALGKGTEGSAAQLCGDERPDSCRELFLLAAGEEVRGVALESVATGYGGPITLMVGILPDGTVSGVKVIDHSETPGLGAHITGESFCAQFAGLAGDESAWELRKNGGTVDQITSATISSQAVLQAVREQARFFNANRVRILSARAEARGP
jgi:electron transport complex protein RnfG